MDVSSADILRQYLATVNNDVATGLPPIHHAVTDSTNTAHDSTQAAAGAGGFRTAAPPIVTAASYTTPNGDHGN